MLSACANSQRTVRTLILLTLTLPEEAAITQSAVAGFNCSESRATGVLRH